MSSNDGIVIVGGGFGGLYTALKVSKQSPNTPVTLIDPKEKFVFLPLLCELAVGNAAVTEVAPLFSDLLKDTNIRFIQTSVNAIDINEKTLHLSSNVNQPHDSISSSFSATTPPTELRFNQLVLACGAQPNLSLVPGAREHAMTFCKVDDSYRLSLQLRALLHKGSTSTSTSSTPPKITILGGGYSGVEIACNLAEFMGSNDNTAQICILDRNPNVMAGSPVHNVLEAEEALRLNGVAFVGGVSIDMVGDHCVTYSTPSTSTSIPSTSTSIPSTSTTINSDLTIATLGMQQSSLITSLPIAKHKSGRVIVDRTLTVPEHRGVVWAIGDCAYLENVPCTAQAAMQMVDILTHNLLATSHTSSTSTSSSSSPYDPVQQDLKSFTFVPLGEMLTLGKKRAAVSSLGGAVTLDGQIAAVARRLVYAIRMPTNEQRIKAAVSSTLTMGLSELRRVLDGKAGSGRG